ncbi:MAG: TonB-dependent siderophore receptor [Cyanobacteria bacterium J06621_8]
MVNRLQWLFLLTSLFSLMTMPALRAEEQAKVSNAAMGAATKIASDEETGRTEKFTSTNFLPYIQGTAKDLILKDILCPCPKGYRFAYGTASHMAQGETRVTGVEVIPTKSGLELILKTVAGSERLVPLIVSEGNELVIDILDATLAFSIRNGITELEPAPGIERITVNQADSNSIQIRITGSDQTPSAEVVAGRDDLVLNITPETTTVEEEEQIDIIATGQVEEDSYQADNATTATRIDVPIRDVPQSIQVIPRKVIEDQGIVRVGDALRNVSGVTIQRARGNISNGFTVRGFTDPRILRNGFRSGDTSGTPISVLPDLVERVEVLKGPSAVLYGQVTPGGAVNYISKKPQKESSYDLEFRAGNFGLLQPALDITGPLTEDKRLTYRLNLSFQNGGNFREFSDAEIVGVAPVIRYDFSDKTNVTLEYEFLDQNELFDDGFPISPLVFEVPPEINFVADEDNVRDSTSHSVYFNLNHRFNDNIRLRTGVGAEYTNITEIGFRPISIDPVTGDITRSFSEDFQDSNNITWQTDLITEFNTGPVKHDFLLGFELTRSTFTSDNRDVFDTENNPFTINVFDPQFDTPFPDDDAFNIFFESDLPIDTNGIYLQDLITLLPNLKLLLGGRYDFVTNDTEFEFTFNDFSGEAGGVFTDEAFSPRVGLVYQPIEEISFYGSFSQSFEVNSAFTAEGDLLDPERGTQFEVGVKGEFGGVSATIAAYNIDQTNIALSDPDNPDFSIPIGEATSRGIEIDVAGEPISGWNIIASLFFNDAFVSEGSEDDGPPIGDNLVNAPRSGASLWTTYELQKGDLEGLGFGAGLFYVGDREASIPNDFVLPSYVRFDASLFYNREKWRAQLNFQNLFDEDFLESSQNTSAVQTGAPFTVVGQLSLDF